MKPLRPIKPIGKINIAGPGEVRPDFDSLFDPMGMDNPLDRIRYTDDVERDSANEISEALRAILEQKRAMREVYRTTTDPEFWFCICFQSRAQKDEFLAAAGLDVLGDKYLDGLAVARHLGIDVQPINLKAQGSKVTPVVLRDTHIIGKGGEK